MKKPKTKATIKLPTKLKEDRRELSREVTVRFLRAMYMIIITHKQSHGVITSVRAFAGSIVANASYFSQYEDPKYNRNVTLEMCCELCRVHSIDANWLLLGLGQMYFEATLQGKVERVEKRLDVLEENLGIETSKGKRK